MSDQPLSAAEKAQLATRIGQLDEQIAARDSMIVTLQGRISTAKKKDQDAILVQIASAREERSAILQEANTIRAQLGMPMVIPSTPQPVAGVPVAAVPVKKRGGMMRGCLIGVAVLVVLFIAISQLGGGSTASTPAATLTRAAAGPTTAPAEAPVAVGPTEAPSPTEVPAPTVPLVDTSHAVGEDVTVGEVRWKVIEATDEGPELKAASEFVEPKKTAGKWVRVRFEIENLSKDQLSFTGVDVSDNQDRTFKPSTDAFMYMPTEESCPFEQLSANVPKTCQVVFELPADAAGLTMKVGDLKLFGADEAVIDLGL